MFLELEKVGWTFFPLCMLLSPAVPKGSYLPAPWDRALPPFPALAIAMAAFKCQEQGQQGDAENQFEGSTRLLCPSLPCYFILPVALLSDSGFLCLQ